MSNASSGSSRRVPSASSTISRGTTITAWPRTRSGGAGTADGKSVATRARTFSGVMCESSELSVPLERTLAPDVDEPEREHRDEDHHLDEPEHAEAAEQQRPGIQEDHLDVEDDEEDGGEVELDREASPGGSARHVPALERLLLDGRRSPRSEQRRHREEEAGNDRRQHEHGEHGNVLELHEGIGWVSRQSTQACQPAGAPCAPGRARDFDSCVSLC